MTSYTIQVRPDRQSRDWVDAQMRFATARDAKHHAQTLFTRHPIVEAWRIVPCDAPPNREVAHARA